MRNLSQNMVPIHYVIRFLSFIMYQYWCADNYLIKSYHLTLFIDFVNVNKFPSVLFQHQEMCGPVGILSGGAKEGFGDGVARFGSAIASIGDIDRDNYTGWSMTFTISKELSVVPSYDIVHKNGE